MIRRQNISRRKYWCQNCLRQCFHFYLTSCRLHPSLRVSNQLPWRAGPACKAINCEHMSLSLHLSIILMQAEDKKEWLHWKIPTISWCVCNCDCNCQGNTMEQSQKVASKVLVWCRDTMKMNSVRGRLGKRAAFSLNKWRQHKHIEVEVEVVVEEQLGGIVLTCCVLARQKNVNGHCWPSMHEYDRQYDSDIASVSPDTKW